MDGLTIVLLACLFLPVGVVVLSADLVEHLERALLNHRQRTKPDASQQEGTSR